MELNDRFYSFHLMLSSVVEPKTVEEKIAVNFLESSLRFVTVYTGKNLDKVVFKTVLDDLKENYHKILADAEKKF